MTTAETTEYIIRILRRNERHYRDELRQLEIQSAGDVGDGQGVA